MVGKSKTHVCRFGIQGFSASLLESPGGCLKQMQPGVGAGAEAKAFCWDYWELECSQPGSDIEQARETASLRSLNICLGNQLSGFLHVDWVDEPWMMWGLSQDLKVTASDDLSHSLAQGCLIRLKQAQTQKYHINSCYTAKGNLTSLSQALHDNSWTKQFLEGKLSILLLIKVRLTLHI